MCSAVGLSERAVGRVQLVYPETVAVRLFRVQL